MKFELNLPKPEMLIYYWHKLLGLAPFSIINNRFYPATRTAKAYVIFIILIRFVFSLITIHNLLKIFKVDSAQTASTDLTGYAIANIILQQILSPISQIFFLLNEKEIVHLLNELCAVNDDLKGSGIREDHARVLKHGFTRSAIANVAIGMFSVINIFCIHPPFITVTLFIIRHLVQLNTVIIFSEILICIRQRFALVNEKLRYDFEPTRQNDSASLLHSSEVSATSENPDEDGKDDSTAITDLERVENIAALHWRLCKLLKPTIKSFQVQILCGIAQHVLSVTPLLDRITFVIVNRNNMMNNSNLVTSHILYPILGMLIATAELLAIVHACMTCCEQANAVKGPIFEVWNKFQLTKMKNDFGMLSVQMMQIPVTLKAFGFFKLDYSCLHTVFYISIMYLITGKQLN